LVRVRIHRRQHDYASLFHAVAAPPRTALKAVHVTPQLQRARGELVPSFTHFLDLPILFLIIALGTVRPTTWALFVIGSLAAIAVATLLTIE
jgi:hypothetical protein